VSAVGVVSFTRRYWKCRCGADGSYAADQLLGIEGRFSKVVQKHSCRLAAETSFASTSEHLHEMLGVQICPETVRTLVEGHGKVMARFQPEDAETAQEFAAAAGEVEFAVDAGKVNTREEGWKDLKIAVISKREPGEPTSPDDWNKQRLPSATMTLAFAMIASAKTFRRSWRSRLLRLGVTCWAAVHALGDGAGWIWKSVQHSLTGCMETLDFFHACEHLHQCAERVFGEATPEAKEAFAYSRGLLLREGWTGVCRWVGELLSVEEEPERERRRPHTDRLIAYFSKHTGRLNYAARLQAGQAIGSGVVEGQAKTLGMRLKRRGARWNRTNVQPMASLVCVRHSRQWAAYWNRAA
jgi:hypothetical protein